MDIGCHPRNVVGKQQAVLIQISVPHCHSHGDGHLGGQRVVRVLAVGVILWVCGVDQISSIGLVGS